MGDPAGCGPAITIDVWTARAALGLTPFFVVGDPRLYRPHIPTVEIDRPDETLDVFERALPVLPIEIDDFENLEPGTPLPSSAQATLQSITKATEHCLAKRASAMVTNPIAKSVLYTAGFQHPGHTEYIAELCSQGLSKPIHPVMMLVGGGLKVSLATIHVPLMSILEHLKGETLHDVARITDTALRRDFGIQSPLIAFTGLNPHAGEDGTIGSEEKVLINPVAAELRSHGVNVSDARSADTVFHESLNGAYDAVIAMTHDQGLIPVKTLDMWGGVNTTLGLPIIRTSPDHGTAFEATAAGTCRSDSLVAAIKLAETMVSNRKHHDG